MASNIEKIAAFNNKKAVSTSYVMSKIWEDILEELDLVQDSKEKNKIIDDLIHKLKLVKE